MDNILTNPLMTTAPGLSGGTGQTRENMARVASDFEEMTISQMLNFMMSEVDLSDTPFGGGMGERAFQPLLVNEYGKAMSGQGGLGIADAVLREMLKMQGLDTAEPAMPQPRTER